MSVGVGIVGLGFMGRTHAEAYLKHGAHLVAVCDSNAAGFRSDSGNFEAELDAPQLDLSGSTVTTSLDEMLAVSGLDLVSVCTPTDTHIAVATAALLAGKHVLVEKPVSLDPVAIERLAAVAQQQGRLCMPAMCMRFWPAWAWVKRTIDERRFGGVRTIRLERIGPAPDWNNDFYSNESRSGSALFDLHIHDTDFILHALGLPSAVCSAGTTRHLSTSFRFDDGPANVSAQGGWIDAPGLAFRMRLLIELEHAVADFDLGRTPELQVHLSDGSSAVPDLEPGTGWEHQIGAILAAIESGEKVAPATLGQAAAVTRVLLAERQSLRTGDWIAVGR